MNERGSDRRPLFALSIALGVALLLIAFLLGRESARAPASEVAEAERPGFPVLEPEAEPVADEVAARRWPEWADPTDWDDAENRTSDRTPATTERAPQQPTRTLYLSNSGTEPDRPSASENPPPDGAQTAVAAYFQQVDVIHSGEGAGDPNAFAMGLIKAGLGGSTSGFDQLIADTEHMEQEMQRLTPPASCESYHRASLEGLAESRQMLESLKRAIRDRDIEQLNAIALHGGSLQKKAQAMKDIRQQILASEGSH